ncbi:MAG: hypothetical protein MI924_13605, partial [Chloroflexales bacterium]|nr:hypothetical protein [Chloroflexales bacterium]
ADMTLQPVVLQQTLSLPLSGFAVLLIFMAIGGYIGYLRGLRALLTITIITIIAYLICVRGGDQIVTVINRFYTNFPKLIAFAAGRNPAEIPLLNPIISGGVQASLFFRLVLFFALVAFGWFFNARPQWYSDSPDDAAEPLARTLGVFTGAFIALLWSNALTVFWQDFVVIGGGFGGPVANILNILPDVSLLVPSLITLFFLVIALIILFNLPKVWRS